MYLAAQLMYVEKMTGQMRKNIIPYTPSGLSPDAAARNG